VRLGKYVIFIKQNDKIYSYNALNNGLCELKPEIYEKILRREFDTLKIENFEVFNELYKTFYIVPKNFSEENYIKMLNWEAKFSKDAISLTIAPTLDCNFNCFYCYQQNYKKPSYMSNEIVDKVLNFIKQRITSSTKLIYINWYGGEPLLSIETIRYLTKELKNISGNQEIRIEASIITNGFLLNEKYSKILSEECNVKTVQITLDGPKDIHDKRRPHKEGSSYEVIMNNLKKSANFFDRVLVRINVDRTNKDFVPELLNELKDMKVQPYLAPVSLDNIENQNFFDICFSIKEFALEYFKMKENVFFSNNISYPFLNFGSCGAVRKNSFVIDPNGNIYKCWNEIGQLEKRVGTVSDGILNYSRYLKWITFDPTEISECKECKILPLCNGGCPYRILFPEEQNLEKRCSEYKWTLKNELSLWIAKQVETIK